MFFPSSSSLRRRPRRHDHHPRLSSMLSPLSSYTLSLFHTSSDFFSCELFYFHHRGLLDFFLYIFLQLTFRR